MGPIEQEVNQGIREMQTSAAEATAHVQQVDAAKKGLNDELISETEKAKGMNRAWAAAGERLNAADRGKMSCAEWKSAGQAVAAPESHEPGRQLPSPDRGLER